MSGGHEDGAAQSATAGAMSLLANGVPLSLLMDLVFGPRSEELLVTERATGQAQRHLLSY